jgi:anthranilate phosphoribosyltransferase
MSIEASTILDRLLGGGNLAESEAGEVIQLLTDEALPQAMSAALLIALRQKGETAEEVRGFAKAMRKLATTTRLPSGLAAADVVGTGGDKSGSVNISTGTALLAAGCGVPVVKHGNRSVSSKSGSADVLEALGVPMPKEPDTPYFHPAMKTVAPVRAAMGVRTVFNILGPLTNPAEPPFQLIGAFDLETARLMAEALMGMDIERAFVVYGEPGWDEATPVGPFTLFDVKSGETVEERRDALDYGIPRCAAEQLTGGDAQFNARALEAVLNGEDQGAHRDALLLGAGLVLELTGRASGLGDGIAKARESLDSGAAALVLERLRAFASDA